MPALPAIYGLDLITDAEGSTIDPSCHRITAIGISTTAGDELYDGDEAELLTLVDRRLELLPDGIVTTWNGSVLALPLLARRAAATGIEFHLRVYGDDRRGGSASVDSPLRGVDRPMWGTWHRHTHLDLAQVYDDGRRWNPLRSRRSTPESHFPIPDELAKRDPRKDARLARTLAERRWPQARKIVSRTPSSRSVAVDVTDSATNQAANTSANSNTSTGR